MCVCFAWLPKAEATSKPEYMVEVSFAMSPADVQVAPRGWSAVGAFTLCEPVRVANKPGGWDAPCCVRSASLAFEIYLSKKPLPLPRLRKYLASTRSTLSPL